MRLPDELVRRAKCKATAEGRSLTGLIEDGLRRVVNDRSSRGRTDRTLPPVSVATGGLMSGAELNDFSALQVTDDLDDAERLKWCQRTSAF